MFKDWKGLIDMTFKRIIALAVSGAFVLSTAAGISDSAQVSAASHNSRNSHHIYSGHRYTFSEYSRDLEREKARHNKRLHQIDREFRHRTHSKHYREAINNENDRHKRAVQRIARKYQDSLPYERTGPGGGGH